MVSVKKWRVFRSKLKTKMQKVYVVTYRKYNGDSVELKVLATTIAKAIVNAERYIKKNYYSSSEIVSVEVYCKVEVYYKS